MSPASPLSAHRNSCFLLQAGRIGTGRDVIALYQSDILGYAVVTNDPQISVAHNNNKQLHFACIVISIVGWPQPYSTLSLLQDPD